MAYKRFHRLLFIAGICGLVVASAADANMLSNASFEDPFAPGPPPFTGRWEPFNAGAGSASVQGSAMPLSGAAHLELLIDGVNNSFAGAFQDVAGLTSGTSATLSGWHATPTDPLGVGVEIRIEWRDSINNVEISRTPNLTVAPGAAYTMFSLTDTVPAGADMARVVYAIQTFGPEPGDIGTVYVDDMSFVPEPSTLALLAICGMAVIRRR